MITPQLAWDIRTTFGHSLNPDAEFSCPRLKEIAARADALHRELRELDDEIKEMAEPPDPPRDAPALVSNILLRPSPAVVRATAALRQLRMGRDVEVDCLEVLDVLLGELDGDEAVNVVSTKGTMDLETVRRLRFERGFEVRPSVPCPNPPEEQS